MANQMTPANDKLHRKMSYAQMWAQHHSWYERLVLQMYASFQWQGHWSACSWTPRGSCQCKDQTSFTSLMSSWVKDAELYRESSQVRDNHEAKVSSPWWMWHTHTHCVIFWWKGDPILCIKREETRGFHDDFWFTMTGSHWCSSLLCFIAIFILLPSKSCTLSCTKTQICSRPKHTR